MTDRSSERRKTKTQIEATDSGGCTSSLVRLEMTLNQSPIILRIAAKYARPTRIQNHTTGL